MRRPLVLSLAALVVAPVCLADWRPHADLPTWAQRGRLHWCLHYARADRARVDLFLDGGQTLIHGGAFDSPETAAYARSRGLRYMPYVCSRTVTTHAIAKAPQLKNAVLLRKDRSEFLAYNNPVRRYGSLHMPAWPEYVRDRVRRLWDRPNVAAIFFDNAVWPGDDHRPEAVAAWKTWAQAQRLDPGDDVPSIYRDERAAASRAFSSHCLTRYHGALHAFCRQHAPPLLNVPNLGSHYGLAAVEAGVVDLVFYETMSHPPFANNSFRYKAGLAASHGKPTGMLAYLPPKIAAQRGERTWHEGMHHFFYPSSPIAEEFALAAAEAAACGGTYVVNYSLFPSLPVTDTADPFCRRIHRAVKQAYSFLHTNETLYAEAQPGSDVAILYSTATCIQNRHLQNVHALGTALVEAGIPYEVVVPSDLTEAGLRGIRTLLLPGVAYADEATAQGILRFARGGGRVVVTGEYAAHDTIGRPARSKAAAELLAPLRLLSRAIRDWTLDGFEPEGTSHVRVKAQQGTASLRFAGPAGRYLAHICITDENDGTSPLSLSAAGKTVYEAKLDVEDNQRRWLTTPAFDLKPGDLVALTVHADGGERGRVHSIALVAAGAGEGAPLGRGRVLHSPIALERLSPDRRLALLQPKARLPRPGEMFVNLMDVPARKLRTVHLVNFDFRYEVEQPGLYASDDGSGEARMFFGGNHAVVRKRVHIPKPEQVVEPVVQLRGFATAECTARLRISVNGHHAASLKAEQMRASRWVEAAIDRKLLRADNLLEIRAEGETDGQQKWIQIGIDTHTKAGNSAFSTDGGKTFSDADLSTDLKAQTGEYMVRIRDHAAGQVKRDPTNPVRNPGFEHARVPHSETKLTVAPATNVEVELAGAAVQPCLALSPDGPPRWVHGAARDGKAVYTVPKVDIYSVLVLGPSREALEPLRRANAAAAPWTLPPVTEPPREITLGWDGYGDGYVADTHAPHSGARCIRCDNATDTDVRGAMQQFTFEKSPPRRLTITAWSRSKAVSGRRDAHYSVYVDATCVDGTLFHGRHTPFEVGTHGWQQATLRLEPTAPIRTMKLFLLFRKHAGTAWFDDVRLTVEATP